MKPNDVPPPLAGLLSKLVDGALSAKENAKLEEILRHSEEARDYYRRYLALHLELSDIFHQESPPGEVAEMVAPWRNWAAFLLPLAAAILVFAGLSLLLPRDQPTDLVGESDAGSGPVLAEVTRAEQVRWSLPEDAAAGQELRDERVRLDAGSLVLTLAGGQVVTLGGPSDFEIVSASEIFLHRGNASLRMEKKGARSGIRVPRGRIVDIGTEFSVRVDDAGTADVWVFEGMAMVSLDAASPDRVEHKTLSVGESVRMTDVLAPSPAKADDFIRPPVPAVSAPATFRERVIADFVSEFPPSALGYLEPYAGGESPAPGWAYLWNPTGNLGQAADYLPLVPNTVDTFPADNGGGRSPMFTLRGDVAYDHRGQGEFVYGRIAATVVHPGQKTHRAIIAYTIQPGEEGMVRIAGSALSKYRIDGPGANGVDLDIFVNDRLIAPLSKDGFQSLIAADFDGELGRLVAGDTVYITLGNNGSDSPAARGSRDAFDACRIQFLLMSEP